MTRRLCSVCRTIPSSFWARDYDLFESCQNTKARLQSYRDMQKQTEKGCHFCALLISCKRLKRMRNRDECLYLRRDYGDPHKAVCLGTQDFQASLEKLYFFRVPDEWCTSNPAGLNDDIDNVDLMRTWLQNRSVPATSSRFLPTRLLDLKASLRSDDVRLVMSQDIRSASTPPYMALSHCWGGVVPIQLQLGNVRNWIKRDIPFERLPKTFRNAVSIAKQLGCRYLWIDSMCIIQDCDKDWRQEASLMAEVYGHAYCTLAALSSKNSSEGCQLNSNIQASLRSPYVEFSEQHKSLRVRVFREPPQTWMGEFNGQPGDSPLRSRGWVLQEKELSNCTIYFARNQLLWENKLSRHRWHRATSQVPWEEIRTQTQAEEPRMMYQDSYSKKIVGFGRHTWYELVEDYTSRYLTVPTDKLMAISGLATSYHYGEQQYLAGLWKSQLPAALLWRVKDYAATRPAYLAPSWSWASLMGNVTYDSLRLEPDLDGAKYEYPEDAYPGLITLKVQAVQMTLEDKEQPFGNVREGRIILSGVRCIRVESGDGNVHFSDGGQPLTHEKAPIGVFYSDVPSDEATRSRELLCVALHSESTRSLNRHQVRFKQDEAMTSMVMGIVVAKLSRSQGYVRVGMARWVNEVLFDAVSTTTIELV